MGNEDFSVLHEKYIHRLGAQYADVKKLAEQNMQGTAKEIFDNLRSQLTEVIDRKAPASLIKLDKEYKELEKQLS